MNLFMPRFILACLLFLGIVAFRQSGFSLENATSYVVCSFGYCVFGRIFAPYNGCTTTLLVVIEMIARVALFCVGILAAFSILAILCLLYFATGNVMREMIFEYVIMIRRDVLHMEDVRSGEVHFYSGAFVVFLSFLMVIFVRQRSYERNCASLDYFCK